MTRPHGSDASTLQPVNGQHPAPASDQPVAKPPARRTALASALTSGLDSSDAGRSNAELSEAKALDDDFNLRLNQEMAAVAQCFADEVASDVSPVNELVDHVAHYRGKMLRPKLVTLSAWAMTPDFEAWSDDAGQRVRTLATVTEMVHMATLVHDDILDEAELRRQGRTVNHLHGNEAAVMLGDYLISHSYHLCSSLDDASIARQVAATTNMVCEGELLQLAHRNDWSLSTRTYFDIIARKTAALTSLCCRLGAWVAGGEPAQVEAMAAFGHELGMGYQIVDDLLDLTGDETQVGKSLGRDAGKGKLTLPVILYLQRATPGQREEAVRLLDLAAGTAEEPHAAGDPERPADALAQRLAESGVLVEAREQAQARVKASIAHLHRAAPESQARGVLERAADRVVWREK